MYDSSNIRKEILLGARRALFEANFHKVSIDDIARYGGHTRRTIYRYFENKETLPGLLKKASGSYPLNHIVYFPEGSHFLPCEEMLFPGQNIHSIPVFGRGAFQKPFAP